MMRLLLRHSSKAIHVAVAACLAGIASSSGAHGATADHTTRGGTNHAALTAAPDPAPITAVDPANPALVYRTRATVAGDVVEASSDGGAHWSPLLTPVPAQIRDFDQDWW